VKDEWVYIMNQTTVWPWLEIEGAGCCETKLSWGFYRAIYSEVLPTGKIEYS
jgi:hypothetical protein